MNIFPLRFFNLFLFFAGGVGLNCASQASGMDRRCVQHTQQTLEAIQAQNMWQRQFADQNARNKGAYGRPVILGNQIEKLGLANDIDLVRLVPKGVFEDEKTFLEVGAGTGRVIRFLKQRAPHSKIYALEHHPGFYEPLSLFCQADPNILVVGESVLKTEKILENSIDTVTWMFGGPAEFSLAEQRKAFKILHKFLRREGTLIVDTVEPETFDPDRLPQNATMVGQRLVLEIEHKQGENVETRELRLMLATAKQIQKMGAQAGLELVWMERYIAGQKFPRISFGFRKPAP